MTDLMVTPEAVDEVLAEPAPESEEPSCEHAHDWTDPRCTGPFSPAQECPVHRPPARPEPSPSLRSVMREILRATGDEHNHDGIASEEDQCPTCSAVTRLLESVVREDAEFFRACAPGFEPYSRMMHESADALLKARGLSPESAPESGGKR